MPLMDKITKLANWVMRVYLSTPMPFRLLYWLIPILYFIFPFDLDRAGLFGRLDDILLMLFSFWAFDRASKFTDFYQEARRDAKNHAKGGGEAPTDTPFDHQSPYDILGVGRGAGKGEIKQAYRRLLRMYHPDKFTHLGPEFERTAQRRTRAIIAAYEKLKS